MIKQLKKRFVILVTVSVSLVLLIILGVTNIVSYNNTMNKIDADILGAVADINYNPQGGNLPGQQGNIVPDVNGNLNRVFIANIGEDGEIESVNIEYYTIITEEQAREIAQSALDNNDSEGIENDYKYLYNEEQGTIFFLDCRVELETINNFILISIIVFFAGVLLVVGIALVLMRPAIEPIVESYNKQKAFITDASHELKTPLTIIETNTELTEMECGESKWTRNSHKQIERLRKLTNDLVMLARMDEENNNTVYKEIDMSDLVNEVIMGYDPVCVASNKKLSFNVEPDVKIMGNDEEIGKLLNILLDNAVKYSSANGTIDVTLSKNGRKKNLTVSNSVDNIAEGGHNEVFERFYRSDKSRNSETGGQGIGLSIAKAIVNKHKGKISAESKTSKSFAIQIIFNN